MSRSFKKTAVFTDYYRGKRHVKRLASKVVRRHDSLSDGRMYRKCYQTYDICDYKFYQEKGDKGYEKAKRK